MFLKVMRSYLFGGDPLPFSGLSLLNWTILALCLGLNDFHFHSELLNVKFNVVCDNVFFTFITKESLLAR